MAKNKNNQINLKNLFARLGSAAMLAIFIACQSPTGPEQKKPETENPTPKPDPDKQALTGDVSIAGTMKPGETLTINIANTNGTGAATYKWTKTKDGKAADIAGANGKTFALTDAEIGYIIGAIVSYADQNGTISGVGGSAVAKELQALLGSVAINGTARVNKTLTADTAGLTNAEGAPSYQWKSGNQAIAGATAQTFKIPAAQFGQEITVTVSYSGNTGSATSAKTAAVAEQLFENVSISITGTNLLGGTLSATVNDPEGNALGNRSTEWRYADAAETLSTAATYSVSAADIGKQLHAKVSFANGEAAATTSGAVPTPAFNFSFSGPAEITNPASQISMEPTFTNVYGTPSVSYSWTVDGAAAGTAQSMTVTSAHYGKNVTGNATASHAGWNSGQITKSAGKADAKDFGTPGRITSIKNLSSLPDSETPWKAFDDMYEFYTAADTSTPNVEKFAKFSIIFADNCSTPGSKSGHRSEAKGVAGNYELVVYIDPVIFAQYTEGVSADIARQRAFIWFFGELCFYNALAKVAPMKQAAKQPVLAANTKRYFPAARTAYDNVRKSMIRNNNTLARTRQAAHIYGA